MRLRKTPKEIDLSHESAVDSDLAIELADPTWVSSVGHAVLFLGWAAQRHAHIRIDVPSIIRVVYGEEHDSTDIPSLAIVMHCQKGNRERIARNGIHGWFSPEYEFYLYSQKDREHVVFEHAIHALLPQDDSLLNQTLLHEAGHLRSHITNKRRPVLYTARNIDRVHKGGVAAAVACAAIAGAATITPAETMLGAPNELVAGLSMAGLAAGVVASFHARSILWLASVEERRADRFAHVHRDINLISSGVEQLPPDHFIVDNKDIAYGLKPNIF